MLYARHTNFCISYLLYNKLPLNLAAYKNKYLLQYTISETQESGINLAGWCWLTIFHEVAVMVLANAMPTWRPDQDIALRQRPLSVMTESSVELSSGWQLMSGTIQRCQYQESEIDLTGTYLRLATRIHLILFEVGTIASLPFLQWEKLRHEKFKLPRVSKLTQSRINIQTQVVGPKSLCTWEPDDVTDDITIVCNSYTQNS